MPSARGSTAFTNLPSHFTLKWEASIPFLLAAYPVALIAAARQSWNAAGELAAIHSIDPIQERAQWTFHVPT